MHEIDKRHVKKVEDHDVVTLYAANGPVEVDKIVPINVGRLGKANVLILEETPVVFRGILYRQTCDE